ncbi:MAG TPA: Bax inhibitor-1/YccA family protein [Gammaproteobacteria bacterium]|nr:Bax inhibitor-1/YccA family protein [Gammaproteobacteria bacterium]
MNPYQQPSVATADSALATNKLIRNTYSLLSMTLLFTAVMAGVAMVLQVSPMVSLLCSGGALILLWFVLPRTANSAAGLGVVFGITGLLGFGLGPVLSMYLGLPNGPQVVMAAFGLTGLVFIGLSGYALTTKKDFSFMGGMLFAGILVAFLASIGLLIAGMFGVNVSGFALGISALFAFLMCGLILFQTSQIVNGGETNYIMATIGLYVAIYNLFTSLLHLLGAFMGEE